MSYWPAVACHPGGPCSARCHVWGRIGRSLMTWFSSLHACSHFPASSRSVCGLKSPALSAPVVRLTCHGGRVTCASTNPTKHVYTYLVMIKTLSKQMKHANFEEMTLIKIPMYICFVTHLSILMPHYPCIIIYESGVLNWTLKTEVFRALLTVLDSFQLSFPSYL